MFDDPGVQAFDTMLRTLGQMLQSNELRGWLFTVALAYGIGYVRGRVRNRAEGPILTTDDRRRINARNVSRVRGTEQGERPTRVSRLRENEYGELDE